MTGTVTNIIEDKNFGFIKSNGIDYFFHKDCFIGDWYNLVEEFNMRRRKPIRVSFDEATSEKGPRAANIQLLGDTR